MLIQTLAEYLKVFGVFALSGIVVLLPDSFILQKVNNTIVPIFNCTGNRAFLNPGSPDCVLIWLISFYGIRLSLICIEIFAMTFLLKMLRIPKYGYIVLFGNLTFLLYLFLASANLVSYFSKSNLPIYYFVIFIFYYIVLGRILTKH